MTEVLQAWHCGWPVGSGTKDVRVPVSLGDRVADGLRVTDQSQASLIEVALLAKRPLYRASRDTPDSPAYVGHSASPGGRAKRVGDELWISGLERRGNTLRPCIRDDRATVELAEVS